MSLDNPSVRHVQAALAASGSAARVIALDQTARSAQEAADSIGCDLGAIVKSLVFEIDGQAVMALVAGDRRCHEKALASALGLQGKANRASAEAVRQATGFAIGGVAPVGHPAPLPVAVDASLSRFQAIYAAAGHPHCVFRTTPDELQRLTGGVVSESIAKA